MPETAIIGPALLYGLIIALYEIIIIHRDVKNTTHRFMHTIHAVILSCIFVLCTMNSELIFQIVPILYKIPRATPIALQVLAGLIAAIKIHALSRVSLLGFNGKGLSETWFHSILVGALIIIVPYIHPFVKPILPNWLLF